MSSGYDGIFRLNRVIPINKYEALVQWAEMGVDLSERWPWQHTVVCSADNAADLAEMSSHTRTYEEVLANADALETREINSSDLDALSSAPSRFYSELQGKGGWW